MGVRRRICALAKAAVADDERRDRSTLVDGSAVATRLSTGETEVMMVQQQTCQGFLRRFNELKSEER